VAIRKPPVAVETESRRLLVAKRPVPVDLRALRELAVEPRVDVAVHDERAQFEVERVVQHVRRIGGQRRRRSEHQCDRAGQALRAPRREEDGTYLSEVPESAISFKIALMLIARSRASNPPVTRAPSLQPSHSPPEEVIMSACSPFRASPRGLRLPARLRSVYAAGLPTRPRPPCRTRPAARRPRARRRRRQGRAHVGVLKVLEELNVPIDCIAGTSMGALVGGGYASGIPPRASRSSSPASTGRRWWAASASATCRRSSRSAPAPRTATISSWASRTSVSCCRPASSHEQHRGPAALLRRTRPRADRFRQAADSLPRSRDRHDQRRHGRDRQRRPGDRHARQHGHSRRIRAGRDGKVHPLRRGMVRNIPVDVARDLCADVVIVVNLVEEEVQREKLRTATQLLGRSTDVMIVANENLQLESLTDKDIRIDVFMGDITTADFERCRTRSRWARRRPGLPRTDWQSSPSGGAVPAWRTAVTSGQDIEARLAAVKFEGLERVNTAYLETRAEMHAGDTVDTRRSVRKPGACLRCRNSNRCPTRSAATRPTRRWNGGRKKEPRAELPQVRPGLYGTEDGDLGFVVYGKHTRTC